MQEIERVECVIYTATMVSLSSCRQFHGLTRPIVFISLILAVELSSNNFVTLFQQSSLPKLRFIYFESVYRYRTLAPPQQLLSNQL